MVVFAKGTLGSPRKSFPEAGPPTPITKRRYLYDLSGKGTPSTLEILKILLRRPDVDLLLLHIDHLLDPRIQDALEELLNQNDRSWSVILTYESQAISTNDGSDVRLRTAFFVLRNVQYLELQVASITSIVPKNESNLVLQNMPLFSQLECFNVTDWPTEQEDLDTLFSCPFAPQLIGIQFMKDADTLPLPVFSNDTAQRIHTFHVEVISMEEYAMNMLIDAIIELPALKNLGIGFPCPEFHDEYVTHQTKLLTWLTREECRVTHLTLHIRCNDQVPMMLDMIPKVPLLSKLRLVGMDLRTLLDPLLQVIPKNPSIEYIALVDYLFGARELQKILRFQLSSRPRLLSVQPVYIDAWAAPNEISDVERVSQVFEILRHVHCSSTEERRAFPLGAWSRILEKIDLLQASMVGLDATYQVLQEVLGQPHRLV